MKMAFYILFALFFALSTAYAESADSAVGQQNVSDSATVQEDDSTEDSDFGWRDFLAWPFIHIFQPVFGVVVYPIAQPIHYAVDNGVIEKSVDLITFGENRNVLVYPVTNLKPGSSTMLGFNYRHRSLFLPRDYLVLESQYFANGDWYFSFRYTKQGILGLPLYGAFRYQQYWDRDGFFVVPGEKEQFVQPDSSINLNWRLSAPITKSGSWNIEASFGIRYNDASLPDNMSDSILVDEKFPIESRGLYQSEFQYPVELSLLFDDLDYSFAPSRGSRFSLSGRYVFVKPYKGLVFDEYDSTGFIGNDFYFDDDKNHDFIRTEIVYQKYIYLGKSGKFLYQKRLVLKHKRNISIK